MESRSTSFIGIVILIILVMGTIVMARGHEDWFINKQSFGKPVIDVGEQAARFGVPYSYTRSGKVIYSDGFEASLAPWNVITGAGFGTVERDNEVSFRGVYSLKFTPAVDGVQEAKVNKIIPFILAGNIGIEVLVAGEAAADNVYLELEVRQDEIYYQFHYKIVMSSTTLYYLKPVSGWTEIASLGYDISTDVGNFHLLKMVINTNTMRYKYVRLDNIVYDISGSEGKSGADVKPDAMLIGLRVVDTSADQGIVRFDDVTVTIDEP